ncbi:MAG TPA: hypothetical protein VF175_13575 [Lacipirellula sp.]
MSKSFWSTTLAACLAVAAIAWTAVAQQPSGGATYASTSGRGELITYFLPGENNKPTTLTIIDPASRRVAVYQLNRDSGEIQLKSVRNIAWDLGMEYFNSGSPLPEEIRRGLERQQ